MKQTRIHCPYCGSLATLRPASAIHGLSDISAGTYLYVCRRWPACDAYPFQRVYPLFCPF